MSKKPFIITVMLTVFGLTALLTAVGSKHNVTVDFKMVEKGIQWLEFIKTGADDAAIRKYFMTHIAPTGGCQSIIHHWARFREWNNETFYEFIKIALGKIPTDKKLKNEDGSLTMLGRRRHLWQTALENTDRLKKDLETLKKIDFNRQAIQRAAEFLPPEAVLTADFYFVLFGHSTAFSVGKENGFDFLQLSRTKDGKIEVNELTEIFAHEMHHTGFAYLQNKNLEHVVENDENISLAGVLAAEGMPTYFIDQPWKHLDEYKSKKGSIYPQVAADWERHTARLKELYREAETGIKRNLEGKIDLNEMMKQWIASDAKGAAYVLGADMMSVIDTYLGREAVLDLARDCRKLLVVYNRAAKKAAEKGKKLFIFNEKLANKLSQYTGK